MQDVQPYRGGVSADWGMEPQMAMLRRKIMTHKST